MNQIEAVKTQCPYCGELIEVLIDCSESQQSYIEDCQVCCCPILFDVAVDENGEIHLELKQENE